MRTLAALALIWACADGLRLVTRQVAPRRATLTMMGEPDTPPIARCGLLVVGLAGNNGVTLVAGQIANQRGLTWESSRDGPKRANTLGCITQVGALSKRFQFTPFDEVAVGGWDVVPTPLGEALYASRILDYDLVRQVRDEMDLLPVWPGVWDADYYGETQHKGATHVASAATRSEQLQHLREDIRRFKAERALDDDAHVTVVRWHHAASHAPHTSLTCTYQHDTLSHAWTWAWAWNTPHHSTATTSLQLSALPHFPPHQPLTEVWSASVERPCEEYQSASELLDAIERDDKERVSPSLVYACAAILEGCSFVNGGSQNTIQPALVELSGDASARSRCWPRRRSSAVRAGHRL